MGDFIKGYAVVQARSGKKLHNAQRWQGDEGEYFRIFDSVGNVEFYQLDPFNERFIVMNELVPKDPITKPRRPFSNNYQREAYLNFCAAFGISHHTLCVAFMIANANYDTAEFGKAAQREIKQLVESLTLDQP